MPEPIYIVSSAYSKKGAIVFKKIIASILVFSFVVTNCDLALALDKSKKSPNRSTLSPISRNAPIAAIEEYEDGGQTKYRINENKSAAKRFADSFRTDGAFLYLNYLIGDALYLNLDADGLRELIDTDLNHLHFEKFEFYPKISKDESTGSFEIPYDDPATGEHLRVRYFKLDDKTPTDGISVLSWGPENNRRSIGIEVIGRNVSTDLGRDATKNPLIRRGEEAARVSRGADTAKILDIERRLLAGGSISQKEFDSVYYPLADKLLSRDAKKIFDRIDAFHRKVSSKAGQAAQRRVSNDLVVSGFAKAPFITEIYGTGYFYFHSYDIRRRVFLSLLALSRGELTEGHFLKRILPDYDFGIVFADGSPKKWKIKKGMDADLRAHFAHLVSGSSEWQELIGSMKARGDITDLNIVGNRNIYPDYVKGFAENGTLTVDMYLPMSDVTWQAVQVFVDEKDCEYFGVIPDLLITPYSIITEKSSDIPDRFKINFFLHALLADGALSQEQVMDKIFAIIRDSEHHAPLIDVCPEMKGFIKENWRGIFESCLQRGFITLGVDGSYRLTKEGASMALEVREQREALLAHGSIDREELVKIGLPGAEPDKYPDVKLAEDFTRIVTKAINEEAAKSFEGDALVRVQGQAAEIFRSETGMSLENADFSIPRLFDIYMYSIHKAAHAGFEQEDSDFDAYPEDLFNENTGKRILRAIEVDRGLNISGDPDDLVGIQENITSIIDYFTSANYFTKAYARWELFDGIRWITRHEGTIGYCMENPITLLSSERLVREGAISRDLSSCVIRALLARYGIRANILDIPDNRPRPRGSMREPWQLTIAVSSVDKPIKDKILRGLEYLEYDRLPLNRMERPYHNMGLALKRLAALTREDNLDGINFDILYEEIDRLIEQHKYTTDYENSRRDLAYLKGKGKGSDMLAYLLTDLQSLFLNMDDYEVHETTTTSVDTGKTTKSLDIVTMKPRHEHDEVVGTFENFVKAYKKASKMSDRGTHTAKDSLNTEERHRARKDAWTTVVITALGMSLFYLVDWLYESVFSADGLWRSADTVVYSMEALCVFVPIYVVLRYVVWAAKEFYYDVLAGTLTEEEINDRIKDFKEFKCLYPTRIVSAEEIEGRPSTFDGETILINRNYLLAKNIKRRTREFNKIIYHESYHAWYAGNRSRYSNPSFLSLILEEARATAEESRAGHKFFFMKAPVIKQTAFLLHYFASFLSVITNPRELWYLRNIYVNMVRLSRLTSGVKSEFIRFLFNDYGDLDASFNIGQIDISRMARRKLYPRLISKMKEYSPEEINDAAEDIMQKISSEVVFFIQTKARWQNLDNTAIAAFAAHYLKNDETWQTFVSDVNMRDEVIRHLEHIMNFEKLASDLSINSSHRFEPSKACDPGYWEGIGKTPEERVRLSRLYGAAYQKVYEAYRETGSKYKVGAKDFVAVGLLYSIISEIKGEEWEDNVRTRFIAYNARTQEGGAWREETGSGTARESKAQKDEKGSTQPKAERTTRKRAMKPETPPMTTKEKHIEAAKHLFEINWQKNRKNAFEGFESAVLPEVKSHLSEFLLVGALCELGLPADERDIDVIKKEYRKLAKKHHTDTAKSDGEAIRRLNAAYAIIEELLPGVIKNARSSLFVRGPPPGSIASVFEVLLKEDVERPLTKEAIAARLGRAVSTIDPDIRALKNHLGLLWSDIIAGEEVFVLTPEARGCANEIIPVLFKLYRYYNARPTVPEILEIKPEIDAIINQSGPAASRSRRGFTSPADEELYNIQHQILRALPLWLEPIIFILSSSRTLSYKFIDFIVSRYAGKIKAISTEEIDAEKIADDVRIALAKNRFVPNSVKEKLIKDLGRAGNLYALSFLGNSLVGPDTLENSGLREGCVYAIGRIGGPDSVPYLGSALAGGYDENEKHISSDRSIVVRAEAANELGNVGGDEALSYLERAIRTSNLIKGLTEGSASTAGDGNFLREMMRSMQTPPGEHEAVIKAAESAKSKIEGRLRIEGPAKAGPGKRSPSGAIAYGNASDLAAGVGELRSLRSSLDISSIGDSIKKRLAVKTLPAHQSKGLPDSEKTRVAWLNDSIGGIIKDICANANLRECDAVALRDGKEWLLDFNTLPFAPMFNGADPVEIDVAKALRDRFGDNKLIVPTSDVIDEINSSGAPAPVLEEYFFHVFLCPYYGHEYTRRLQEWLYSDNYLGFEEANKGKEAGHKDGLLSRILARTTVKKAAVSKGWDIIPGSIAIEALRNFERPDKLSFEDFNALTSISNISDAARRIFGPDPVIYDQGGVIKESVYLDTVRYITSELAEKDFSAMSDQDRFAYMRQTGMTSNPAEFAAVLNYYVRHPRDEYLPRMSLIIDNLSRNTYGPRMGEAHLALIMRLEFDGRSERNIKEDTLAIFLKQYFKNYDLPAEDFICYSINSMCRGNADERGIIVTRRLGAIFDAASEKNGIFSEHISAYLLAIGDGEAFQTYTDMCSDRGKGIKADKTNARADAPRKTEAVKPPVSDPPAPIYKKPDVWSYPIFPMSANRNFTAAELKERMASAAPKPVSDNNRIDSLIDLAMKCVSTSKDICGSLERMKGSQVFQVNIGDIWGMIAPTTDGKEILCLNEKAVIADNTSALVKILIYLAGGRVGMSDGYLRTLISSPALASRLKSPPPGSVPSVFNLLLEKARPMTKGEIAAELRLSATTVERDLATLGYSNLRLLDWEMRGRTVTYSINDKVRANADQISVVLGELYDELRTSYVPAKFKPYEERIDAILGRETPVERQKKMQRHNNFWDVVEDLRDRLKMGLGITPKDLREGEDKDWTLLEAARKFGVELPKFGDRYPTRLSVTEELARRSSLGWPSGASDLTSHSDKKYRDNALLDAARRFGLILPLAKPPRILDEKLCRIGFDKKIFRLPFELRNRVRLERERDTLRIVDVNDENNQLIFGKGEEGLFIEVSSSHGEPALKEGILRSEEDSTNLMSNKVTRAFAIRVLRNIPSPDGTKGRTGRKEAILRYIKSVSSGSPVKTRNQIVGDIVVGLPRIYEDKPGTVNFYHDQAHYSRFLLLEQADDPLNYVLFEARDGNVYLINGDDESSDECLKQNGLAARASSSETFKQFDLKVARPQKVPTVKSGQAVASLGQAGISFHRNDEVLVERRDGAIRKKEEWARDRIVFKNPSTEEIITVITRVGLDEFTIEGFTARDGEPLIVKTDHINISTLVYDFPENSSPALKRYFSPTVDTYNAARYKMAEVDGRQVLVRDGYKGYRTRQYLRRPSPDRITNEVMRSTGKKLIWQRVVKPEDMDSAMARLAQHGLGQDEINYIMQKMAVRVTSDTLNLNKDEVELLEKIVFLDSTPEARAGHYREFALKFGERVQPLYALSKEIKNGARERSASLYNSMAIVFEMVEGLNASFAAGQIAWGDPRELKRNLLSVPIQPIETAAPFFDIEEHLRSLSARLTNEPVLAANVDNFLTDAVVVGFDGIVIRDENNPGKTKGGLFDFNTRQRSLVGQKDIVETGIQRLLSEHFSKIYPGKEVRGLSVNILKAIRDRSGIDDVKRNSLYQEYLFHVIFCPLFGHPKARKMAETRFPLTYAGFPWVRPDETKDGLLTIIIREVRDSLAGADEDELDGFDYLPESFRGATPSKAPPPPKTVMDKAAAHISRQPALPSFDVPRKAAEIALNHHGKGTAPTDAYSKAVLGRLKRLPDTEKKNRITEWIFGSEARTQAKITDITFLEKVAKCMVDENKALQGVLIDDSGHLRPAAAVDILGRLYEALADETYRGIVNMDSSDRSTAFKDRARLLTEMRFSDNLANLGLMLYMINKDRSLAVNFNTIFAAVNKMNSDARTSLTEGVLFLFFDMLNNRTLSPEIFLRQIVHYFDSHKNAFTEDILRMFLDSHFSKPDSALQAANTGFAIEVLRCFPRNKNIFTDDIAIYFIEKGRLDIAEFYLDQAEAMGMPHVFTPKLLKATAGNVRSSGKFLIKMMKYFWVSDPSLFTPSLFRVIAENQDDISVTASLRYFPEGDDAFLGNGLAAVVSNRFGEATKEGVYRYFRFRENTMPPRISVRHESPLGMHITGPLGLGDADGENPELGDDIDELPIPVSRPAPALKHIENAVVVKEPAKDTVRYDAVYAKPGFPREDIPVIKNAYHENDSIDYFAGVIELARKKVPVDYKAIHESLDEMSKLSEEMCSATMPAAYSVYLKASGHEPERIYISPELFRVDNIMRLQAAIIYMAGIRVGVDDEALRDIIRTGLGIDDSAFKESSEEPPSSAKEIHDRDTIAEDAPRFSKKSEGLLSAIHKVSKTSGKNGPSSALLLLDTQFEKALLGSDADRVVVVNNLPLERGAVSGLIDFEAFYAGLKETGSVPPLESTADNISLMDLVKWELTAMDIDEKSVKVNPAEEDSRAVEVSFMWKHPNEEGPARPRSILLFSETNIIDGDTYPPMLIELLSGKSEGFDYCFKCESGLDLIPGRGNIGGYHNSLSPEDNDTVDKIIQRALAPGGMLVTGNASSPVLSRYFTRIDAAEADNRLNKARIVGWDYGRSFSSSSLFSDFGIFRKLGNEGDSVIGAMSETKDGSIEKALKTSKFPGMPAFEDDGNVDTAFHESLLKEARPLTREEEAELDGVLYEARRIIEEKESRSPPAAMIRFKLLDLNTLGIPRFDGAYSLAHQDLIIGRAEEGQLVLYTTKRFYEEHLKVNPMLLADRISHEWQENPADGVTPPKSHAEASESIQKYKHKGIPVYLMSCVLMSTAEGDIEAIEHLIKISDNIHTNDPDNEFADYVKWKLDGRVTNPEVIGVNPISLYNPDGEALKFEDAPAGQELKLLDDNMGRMTEVYKANYNGTRRIAKMAKSESFEFKHIFPQINIIRHLMDRGVGCVVRIEDVVKIKRADGERTVILFEDLKSSCGGMTLDNFIVSKNKSSSFNAVEIVKIMIKVLKAIKEIQDNGVYHWDIKPQNIWITESGDVKILDFDISYREGENPDHLELRRIHKALTPRYTSLRRQEYSAISAISPELDEIYSCGVVLAEALNLPVESYILESFVDVRRLLRDTSAGMYSMPKALSDVLERALLQDSPRAYKNMEEFIYGLERAASIGTFEIIGDWTALKSDREEFIEAVKSRDSHYILDTYVRSQIDTGALTVDINLHSMGRDEITPALDWLINTIQERFPAITLSIDSAYKEDIITALRALSPGSSILINSIGMTNKDIEFLKEEVVPIAFGKKLNVGIIINASILSVSPSGFLNEAEKFIKDIRSNKQLSDMLGSNIYIDIGVSPLHEGGRRELHKLMAFKIRPVFKGIKTIGAFSNMSELSKRPGGSLLRRAFIASAVALGLDSAIMRANDEKASLIIEAVHRITASSYGLMMIKSARRIPDDRRLSEIFALSAAEEERLLPAIKEAIVPVLMARNYCYMPSEITIDEHSQYYVNLLAARAVNSEDVADVAEYFNFMSQSLADTGEMTHKDTAGLPPPDGVVGAMSERVEASSDADKLWRNAMAAAGRREAHIHGRKSPDYDSANRENEKATEYFLAYMKDKSDDGKVYLQLGKCLLFSGQGKRLKKDYENAGRDLTGALLHFERALDYDSLSEQAIRGYIKTLQELGANNYFMAKHGNAPMLFNERLAIYEDGMKYLDRALFDAESRYDKVFLWDIMNDINSFIEGTIGGIIWLYLQECEKHISTRDIAKAKESLRSAEKAAERFERVGQLNRASRIVINKMEELRQSLDEIVKMDQPEIPAASEDEGGAVEPPVYKGSSKKDGKKVKEPAGKELGLIEDRINSAGSTVKSFKAVRQENPEPLMTAEAGLSSAIGELNAMLNRGLKKKDKKRADEMLGRAREFLADIKVLLGEEGEGSAGKTKRPDGIAGAMSERGEESITIPPLPAEGAPKTYFGRNGNALNYAVERAIERLADGEEMSVLTLGSSTGEEGYDVAMAIAEYKIRTGKNLKAKVVISDVDDQLVAYARAGIYGTEYILKQDRENGNNDLSDSAAKIRYNKFFVPLDDRYSRILSPAEFKERFGIDISFEVIDIFDAEKLKEVAGKNGFNLIIARNVHVMSSGIKKTEAHELGIRILHNVTEICRPNGLMQLGYGKIQCGGESGTKDALWSIFDRSDIDAFKKHPAYFNEMASPVFIDMGIAALKFVKALEKAIVDSDFYASADVTDTIELMQMDGRTKMGIDSEYLLATAFALLIVDDTVDWRAKRYALDWMVWHVKSAAQASRWMAKAVLSKEKHLLFIERAEEISADTHIHSWKWLNDAMRKQMFPREDSAVLDGIAGAMSENREAILKELLDGAEYNPEFRKPITGDAVHVGCRLHLAPVISKGIAPVTLVKNFTSTAYKPAGDSFFFALIDEINPSNAAIFKVDILEGGMVKVSAAGDESDSIVISRRDYKKKYTLYKLIEGRRFTDSLVTGEVSALKTDRVSGDAPYAHHSFVRAREGVKGVAISITPVTDGSQDRYWITPGRHELEPENKEFYACLVDRKALKAIPENVTLDEIKASDGKLFAYPIGSTEPPEWLRINGEDGYEYYWRCAATEDAGRRFAVFRRIDKEDRITSVRISPDKKTFTIEGLNIDGKPLVFEEGHLNLSTLLYILTNDSKDELGEIPEAIRAKVEVSESLKALACDLDRVVYQARASIPASWSAVARSDGNSYWTAGGYRVPVWIVTRSHNPEIDKPRVALRKLKEVRDDIVSGLTGKAVRPGIADIDALIKGMWAEKMASGKVFAYPLASGNIRKEQAGRFWKMLNPGRTQYYVDFIEKNKSASDMSPVFREHTDDEVDFKKIFETISPDVFLFNKELDSGVAAFCVNKFPSHMNHFLLVPEPEKRHPQYLTEQAVNMALEVMDMSAEKLYFGFNSRGAWASINNLHLHGIYHPDGTLPIEDAETVPYKEIDGCMVSMLKDYPAGTAVFSSGNRSALAKGVMRFVKLLQEKNIPHNIMMAKDRIYVFPKSESGRYAENERFGYMELSGEVVGFLDAARFDKLTERDIEDEMRRVTITGDELEGLLEETFSGISNRSDGIVGAMSESNLAGENALSESARTHTASTGTADFEIVTPQVPEIVTASADPNGVIIEIDARALCATYKTTIGNIPQAFWDNLIEKTGAGVIWIKAPWRESPLSHQLMQYWSRVHNETLTRTWGGYDVYDYVVDSSVAASEEEFRQVTEYINSLGPIVITDFVSNHVSFDSPLAETLAISYTDEEFAARMRVLYPDATRGLNDSDIVAWARRNTDPFKDPGAWIGEITPEASASLQPGSSLIIAHAREGRFNPSMMNLAQIAYAIEYVRNHMKGEILQKIRYLTNGGGLRADLAFLALRAHVYDVWVKPAGISWADFEKAMPCEFWQEFQEELQGEFVITETYDWGDQADRPWTGRAGTLQNYGMHTYDKKPYDYLREGNISALRDYIFNRAPSEFMTRSVHFTENHDEAPAIAPMGFGSRERALAATALQGALPGHLLIPLRQLTGMGIPEGARMEMKSPDGGIYAFEYPDIAANPEALDENLIALTRFLQKPVFRNGKLYEAFMENYRYECISYVRHSDYTDVLAMVNYTNGITEQEVDLNRIFDKYKSDPDAPRAITRALKGKLLLGGAEIVSDIKGGKFKVRLPPWSSCLLEFGVFSESDRPLKYLPEVLRTDKIDDTETPPENIMRKSWSENARPLLFIPENGLPAWNMDEELRAGNSAITGMRVRADRAKDKSMGIVIAIETSWLPENQMADIQPLISELCRGDYLRHVDLNNIRIVRGRGNELAQNIMDAKEELEAKGLGVPLKNVVIVGPENVLLKSGAFDGFISTETEERAFLACIDPATINTLSYKALMRTLALATNEVEETPENSPIYAKRIQRRVARYTQRYDCNDFPLVYELQTKQVRQAA